MAENENLEIENQKKKKKEEWQHLTRIGIMVFVTFTVSILFFFAIFRFDFILKVWKKFMSSASPIIIGLVLAYLMNPIMLGIEKKIYSLMEKKSKKPSKKVARILAITGTVLILLAAMALLIRAIVPSIMTSIYSLSDTLPNDVANIIEKTKKSSFGQSEYFEYISNALISFTDNFEVIAKEKLVPVAQTYLTQITSGVFSFFKAIFDFLVGIVVMVYAMTIQDTLIGQTKKVIYATCKPKTGNTIIEIIRKTNDIFGGFITGKILDSLIIGVIAYIGCFALSIPSPVLIAVIIGVTNVIPVFGPFIGAIPCLLLVVIQSPIHALYLLVFILVLQQVDGNIIGPKILGSSTGLSTFWVMAAILIGGGMFGFLGMLLGVPMFGLIYYLVKRITNSALRSKKLSENSLDYTSLERVDEKSFEMIYPKKTETEKTEE